MIKQTASSKRVNPVKLNINKLNVNVLFCVYSLTECHRYYHVILVTIYFIERTHCADADVDSLQDLMTFTTKTEEERLMASSKQVQHTQYSHAFTDDAFSSSRVFKSVYLSERGEFFF